MTPTDIPDLTTPIIKPPSFAKVVTEPPPSTALMKAVEQRMSDTHVVDLSKVEVLNRAILRLTKQVALSGINAATLSLMRLYERMYDTAPGVEAVVVSTPTGYQAVAA